MKKFFISLAVLVVAIASFCSIPAEGKKEAVGASICCSSGDRGACFGYIEQNTTFPMYDCIWTGLAKDSCYFAGILVRVIRDWL